MLKPSPITILRSKAVHLIESLVFGDQGLIFTVCFKKRTGEQEVREMNCRGGVKKGVKGEGLKFNPRDKGLFVVYDLQKIDPAAQNTRQLLDPNDKAVKGAFRMINEEGLLWIRANGNMYVVED